MRAQYNIESIYQWFEATDFFEYKIVSIMNRLQYFIDCKQIYYRWVLRYNKIKTKKLCFGRISKFKFKDELRITKSEFDHIVFLCKRIHEQNIARIRTFNDMLRETHRAQMLYYTHELGEYLNEVWVYTGME